MVTAIIVIEMMGRPPEHLKENLEKYVDKLDDVKGVKVISKKSSEPKDLKESDNLYTIFSEVELECDTLKTLGNVMFDFMPASVEVVEPSKVVLTSDEATDFMNALTGRLHRYDDVVKVMQNKGAEVINRFNMAKQLLLEHGIIDKDGKVLKGGEGKVTEKKDLKKKKNSKKK